MAVSRCNYLAMCEGLFTDLISDAHLNAFSSP